MLRIAIHAEDMKPRVFEFDSAERVSFGRAPENQIVLDPTYVSRFHGEFVKEDDQWTVVDLGSRTGLRVVQPDSPESPRELHEGDRMVLRGGETIHILYTVLQIELKPALDAGDSSLDEGSQTFTLSPIASTKLSEAATLPDNLRSDSHKLELLLELAKDLSRLDRLHEVLERIGLTVFEALPSATHFSICVPSRTGAFTPIFGTLRDGSAVPREEIRVSQSILGQAVERQIAMLFDPAQLGASMSESIVLNQIASSIAVPLRGSREHIGVIQIDNRASSLPFSQRDLDYTIAIASSAAFSLERAQFQADIQRMFEGFVDASITAIEARDPTTSGHSRRVAAFSVALARAVSRTRAGPLAGNEFREAQLTELSYAALLHDFGKVGVAECVLTKANRLYPEQLEQVLLRSRLIRAASRNAFLDDALANHVPRDEALERFESEMAETSQRLDEALELIQEVNAAGYLSDELLERIQQVGKMSFPDDTGQHMPLITAEELTSLSVRRGTLTKEERRAIESHVIQSFRVLEQIPWSADLENVPSIVLAHHEKLDGSGYPQGLKASQIPIRARLLTVCDIFDAVTASDRPYRSAMPIEGGIDILRSEAESGEIDTDLVELFIDARIWEPR